MTSKENGKVTPGIATGAPIVTPALTTPNCSDSPKILIPGLVRIPAAANCDRVSFDWSGVPIETFAAETLGCFVDIIYTIPTLLRIFPGLSKLAAILPRRVGAETGSCPLVNIVAPV